METSRGVQVLTTAAAMLAGMAGQLEGHFQPASNRERIDTPAAQPGAALDPKTDRKRQVLAPLEGRWIATMERGPAWKPAPGAPDRADDATESAQSPGQVAAERTWVLGGTFLQESLSAAGAEGAGREPGLVFWGFDTQLNRYSIMTLDAATGSSCLLYGEWNSDTQTIVFRGMMPDKGKNAETRPGAAVLRMVSEGQHVVEVFAIDRSESRERPMDAEPHAPPQPNDRAPAEDNGAEEDSAKPGTAKLPAMNPPDRPAGGAEEAMPEVPLDEANLILRINYKRADGPRADAGPEKAPEESGRRTLPR